MARFIGNNYIRGFGGAVSIGESYKIGTSTVLSSTTLGSSVVNSSLTSVGTLGSLNVSGIGTLGSLTVSGQGTLGSLNVSGIGTLGSLNVSGQTAIKSVTEGVEQRSASQSGSQTYNFGSNAIFYHPSVGGNITAVVTNVPVTGSRAHSIAIIFNQGGTPYIINTSFSVNGTAVNVKWVEAKAPTGEANRVDIFNFTMINVGSDASPSWQVYGSKSFFG